MVRSVGSSQLHTPLTRKRPSQSQRAHSQLASDVSSSVLVITLHSNLCGVFPPNVVRAYRLSFARSCALHVSAVRFLRWTESHTRR